MGRAAAILEFWFGTEPCARDPGVWFAADAAFDDACRAGFLADYERAAAGALDQWRGHAQDTLALILLLDQFPRNMFRGTSRAFATDAKALSVARQAVARGFDAVLPPRRRAFVYLPFEHSEDLADQDESVRLFRQLGEADSSPSGYVKYAEQHREVIRRFGRFPSRNAILGRASTEEESRFLAARAARIAAPTAQLV